MIDIKRVRVRRPACVICQAKAETKMAVCADCNFWAEKAQMMNAGHVIRAGGQHYIFKTDNSYKGMGGRKFRVSFIDGRTIETDNLWHQGRIPARWSTLLADNAVLEVI